MATLQALPPEARRLLELARRDRAAARAAVAELDAKAQAALVGATPAHRRSELFDLIARPEDVVPLLPPAELCFTARAIGVEETGWLLSCATEEQLTAAIDLDVWSGLEMDRRRFGEWMVALADAGEDTLVRAARAIDFEVLVLQLRERAYVVLISGADDWEPPEASLTLDGVFHLVAREPGDDLADLMELVRALFQNDYWTYFRLVQGGIWEPGIENEEYALRWRRGRLQDLGFPDPEDAKRVYSFLRDDQLARLPGTGDAGAVDPTAAPAWLPALALGDDAEHALFRAMGRLSDEEREPVRHAFLTLVNRLALADERSLGDPATLGASLEKAAGFASAGLEHLAGAHELALDEVLRRAPVERLFQVGHNLARRAKRAAPPAD